MHTIYIIKWHFKEHSFLGVCSYKTYTEAKDAAEELKDDHDGYEILRFTTD